MATFFSRPQHKTTTTTNNQQPTTNNQQPTTPTTASATETTIATTIATVTTSHPSPPTTITMSILNHIKRARDHKEAVKSKEVEQHKTTKPTQAYRHIPTHAACDSVSSGPMGSRRNDRSKVRAENRKRTAKVVAEAVAESHYIQMNFPGSTTSSPFASSSSSSSGSSTATYQASEADFYDGDVSPMSRSPVQSFGFPAPPTRNFYQPSEAAYPHPLSLKGKEVVRGPTYGMAYSVSPSKDSLPEHFQTALMI
ncbi:Hypothetical protein NCS54_00240900 [Fusarium falciforme]|uniref:Hypothetical protein n=1 Tax=Fusarium falciforme TaxID=195108 RepID=UPI002300676D|nr:Hypothetical protein NCS54_00240900 [Fusarium falciforme]WAO85173.1 Hypothetical protein NCS54_00240900 [Fusarium falciforme]